MIDFRIPVLCIPCLALATIHFCLLLHTVTITEMKFSAVQNWKLNWIKNVLALCFCTTPNALITLPAICQIYVPPIINESVILFMKMFANNSEYRFRWNQIMGPQFILLVIIFLWEISSGAKTGMGTSTNNCGPCAAGRIIVYY